MADKPWRDAVLIASQSRFGLGSGAHIHGACNYWRAPYLVDGAGGYCLNFGISGEHKSGADAVKLCAGEISGRFCRSNGGCVPF